MSLSHKLAQTITRKNIPIDDVVVVLKKYKLLSILPTILQAIKQIHSKTTALESIVIETPFEIDVPAINAIEKIIGNTTAEKRFAVNKNVLAGFKTRYQGRLYDGSGERIIRQLMSEQK